MSAALRIEAPGPLTTLQDLGRRGWLRFGVPASGAMDPVSLAVANILAGNPPGTAALEITLSGGTFAVLDAPVRVAFTGGDFPLAIDGEPAAAGRSHRLEPGQKLRIGAARAGARGYLAVAGGFAVEPVLGSRSTHVRSGIGGFQGRPLAAGDVLPVGAAPVEGPERTLPPSLACPRHASVRVIPGPQDDYFTPEALEVLLRSEYVVSQQADRMGYRLAGPKIGHAKGFNIVSDAIAPGSIQVPGTGEPIILLADRQTTGGYPKIATVIAADLPDLGQRRPGDRLRFEAVSLEEAAQARRRLAQWLAELPQRLATLGGELDSERLLSVNLVSGIVDASRTEADG